MDRFLNRVEGTNRLTALTVDGDRILGAQEMWQS